MTAPGLLTPYEWLPRTSVRLASGPWTSVNEAIQPVATTDPSVLAGLSNGYLKDTEFGSIATGFPGFSLMGARLGTGANRTGQRIVQFTKRSGTEYTVGFCGGQVYTYNWSTNAWTEILTGAELTAAAITLSATARVYCVTFADKLIVNDGINTPWAWDGTAHAGLTKLTNCPVLYGQPVVYYAQFAGIKAASRQTVVWSEPGDPTIGYDTAPYNNAWDLIQTGTEGLVALGAMDAGLLFYRQNSTGAITGSFPQAFATGVREGVSQEYGTRSPAGVLVAEKACWSVDQYGRLRRSIVGNSEEIALGTREAAARINPVYYDQVMLADWSVQNLILVAVPGQNQSSASQWFAVHRQNGQYVGKREGFLQQTLDLVKDGNGVPVLVHFGGTDSTLGTTGYAYVHGTPDGNTWDNGLNAASEAIAHQLTTGFLGFDEIYDKQFDRCDISMILPTAVANIGLAVRTPRSSRTLSVAGPQLLGSVLDGLDVLGDTVGNTTFVVGESGAERHVRAGLKRSGRWAQVTLTHQATGERLGVQKLSLRAFPLDERGKIV